ncbi:OLC1v1002529C1 [Oldenlandia corymbosa var. corymbosa]|uniref:OLC1v1002529C1 n=1 Tax=Oldenlandia corymbosa var. corymbosa TaxID=529605 RepID=A0AAV1DAP2_OLDCO|nr:OLC1v1002529C1 [Oldenlandia corymbosa var. corymbosa]
MPFWIRRASNKIAFKSVARCFHGSCSVVESPFPRVETLWFVKVVCTLTVCDSDDLTVFCSDYFRNHLNPTIAFFAIQQLNYGFNNPRLAFEFFQFTRLNLNLVHSVSSSNLLLRSLCQMGHLDLAELLLQCMNNDGCLPDRPVLECLISSLGNASKFGLAKEILVSQAQLCIEKEMIISSVVHNILLSMLVKRSRVDDAVSFFQDYILRLGGFHPDTCSFNIVIGGLCRTGKAGKAFDFFYDMSTFGCSPDRITYNSLINGLCMGGNVDRAVDLLREMQSQVGVAPDVVTYTSVISGLCKLEKMEEATAFLDEMIQHRIRPNLVTLNILIDGFGKSGDMGSALKMLDKMADLNCCPDVITFTSLISGHCQIGELDQGLKLWDEMTAKKLFPNVYTFSIVIGALCKENRINEARDLLRQLFWRDDIIPKAFIYNPVIDGFCKAGNVDEANAIFAEMEAKKCSPDKYTFTILILGHCMKGRICEAIDLFDKMLIVGCVPDEITIKSLVSCLLKAGKPNEAYRIKRAASEGIKKAVPACKRPELVKDKIDIPVAV